MKVTVELEFDPVGKRLVSDRLEISRFSCVAKTGEGGWVDVPPEYLAVLLNAETKDEGYRLLDATLQFNECARRWLLATAATMGLKYAWEQLRKLESWKPKGPTIYRAIKDYSFEPLEPYISITDGRSGFKLYVEKELYRELSVLPLNAYTSDEKVSCPIIDRSMFAQIQAETVSFFQLLCRLSSLETVTDRRKIKIVETFFQDRKEAFRLLEAAEKDDNYRRAKEEFWRKLKSEGAIEIEGGYLVEGSYDRPVFLVKESGELFLIGKPSKLGFVDETDAKEKAFRIYRSGKILAKLTAVKPDSLHKWELEEIARRAGRLNPALTLILAP